MLEYVTRIDPVGILHPSDASEFESMDTWFWWVKQDIRVDCTIQHLVLEQGENIIIPVSLITVQVKYMNLHYWRT